MSEDGGMIFLRPGMTVEHIGNCVIMKCDNEDDAIILMETIKQMDGKAIFVEPMEEDNA